MGNLARGGRPLAVMAVGILLLAILAAATQTQARDSRLELEWEKCVFEVPATTYKNTQEWLDKVRGTGALVTVVASPRLYLGRASHSQIASVRSLGIDVHQSSMASLRAAAGDDLTPEERAALRVCAGYAGGRSSGFSSGSGAEAAYSEHVAHPSDVEAGYLSDVMTASHRAAPVASASDSSWDGYTTDAVGDIAVGLILFESDGTLDSNWFDWAQEDIDSVTTWLTSVLDNYSVVANQYAQQVTWRTLAFDPTDSVMQVPWQNHLHMGPFGGGLNFAMDTLPAWIYDNFGIDTVDTDTMTNNQYWQGDRGWRPLELNKIIADSMGADKAVHHFVGHATTLCDYEYGSGRGWPASAAAGKCAYYGFRRSERNYYDSCIVNWMPRECFIAHEGLHVFGAADEYGSTCFDRKWFGDQVIDGREWRSCLYNTRGCPFPNFRFPCVMQGPVAYEWDDICPGTAVQVGWLGADYGDAPSPYSTKKSDDGARHVVSGFEWLGKSTVAGGQGAVSFENDADSVSADFIDRDGDSNLDSDNGDNCDDGVFFTCTLNEDALDTVEVIMSNHGGGSYRFFDSDTAKIYLNGWIDYNGDGDWDDADEHFIESHSWIPADTMDLSDTVIFTFTPPEDYADTIWARFRLDLGEDCGAYTKLFSDSTLNGYKGPAIWGEVEDYQIINGLEVNWLRGDLDGGHDITSLDLGILIDYLFAGGAEPVPLEAADLNCDTAVDALDLTIMIDVLYSSGSIPCSP